MNEATEVEEETPASAPFAATNQLTTPPPSPVPVPKLSTYSELTKRLDELERVPSLVEALN